MDYFNSFTWIFLSCWHGFKYTKTLDKIFNTVIGVSMIVGGYGILQLLNVLPINQGGVRLDATFGNATYLAIYMVFNIFLAMMFLVRKLNDRYKKEKNIFI